MGCLKNLIQYFSENKSLDKKRKIVSRYSGGNYSLQRGLFNLTEYISQRKDAVSEHDFMPNSD